VEKAFSTNSAGSTGCYHVEECKLILSYLLVQSSSLSGTRNSTKTRDTETYRGESREKPQKKKKKKKKNTGEKFLNRTAMVCAVRLRIDKWDLIQLQSFREAKDTVNKTKRPPTDWEKIFTNPKSDRGLISNIYK
jgi:hypothetical protein